jgi:hypothetical protein
MFTERYEDQTTEMKRSLLEYMKSMRVKSNAGAGAGAGAGNNEEQPLTEMKMTGAGYPILPDIVLDGLTKKKCEIILRTYLSQHHCEGFRLYHDLSLIHPK